MLVKSYDLWLKILIIAVGIYVLGTVTAIYLPIIVSLILAFILNPIVNYFSKLYFLLTGTEIVKGIAVLLTFVIAALFFGILGTFVVFPFMQEFDKFIIDLPSLVTRIQDIGIELEHRASLLDIPVNINTLIQQTIASAAAFSADLVKRMLQAIFGFASSIIQLVVVPVLTYYFLKDWLILKERLITMFAVDSRNRVRNVIEELSIVISGYIRGQVLISVVIGVIVFCGMYILKIDYPLVLGLLAACTETIPIIGPIVGSIPAIMLAYLVSPALAVKVIIFYIIVHQIENHIVVPNIMGHTIALHPVVVIISLLIGGQLLGIIGMMLAVPTAAILRVVIKQLWNITER